MATCNLFETNNSIITPISKEDIIANQEGLNISLTNDVTVGSNQYILTDVNHPFVVFEMFPFFSKKIVIDPTFYEQNKSEVDSLLTEMVKETQKEKMGFEDDRLINEDLLNALNNSNVKRVSLGSVYHPYSLTKDTYDKLSNMDEIYTDAVSEDLDNNYDSKIIYNYRTKKLLGSYSYERLMKNNELFISEPLDNLDDLNLVNDGTTLNIELDNYERVIDIVRKSTELGKIFTFNIKVKDKNEFNKVAFLNEEALTSNLITVNCGTRVDINKYLNVEKRLTEMVKAAENLSPLEKYLYAYNVTKKIKKYKENKNDRDESRNLYRILDSEYIVCAGFANLLIDLLSKLGIEAMDYSATVQTGFDSIKRDAEVMSDDVNSSLEFHARAMVNLVDPKYGIDGFYLTDPTWDNDLEHDLYNYALLSHDEYNEIGRENSLSYITVNELLFIHSLEEFYQKINVILDMRKRYKHSDGKGYLGDSSLIRNLFDVIKDVDNKKYQELMEKYKRLFDYGYVLNKEDALEVLEELGEYFLTKVNKNIPGEVIRAGVSELYTNVYNVENLGAVVDEIFNYNARVREIVFPKRYKINESGEKEVYANEENKFDFCESGLKL